MLNWAAHGGHCGLTCNTSAWWGLRSVVGLVTGYRLDGLSIESRWRWDFPHPSRPAVGPPSLLYDGYQVFPGGVKSGWGVTLTSHPLLVPWSWKGRAIPLLHTGCTACTEPQCLYMGRTLPLLFTSSVSNTINLRQGSQWTSQIFKQAPPWYKS